MPIIYDGAGEHHGEIDAEQRRRPRRLAAPMRVRKIKQTFKPDVENLILKSKTHPPGEYPIQLILQTASQGVREALSRDSSHQIMTKSCFIKTLMQDAENRSHAPLPRLPTIATELSQNVPKINPKSNALPSGILVKTRLAGEFFPWRSPDKPETCHLSGGLSVWATVIRPKRRPRIQMRKRPSSGNIAGLLRSSGWSLAGVSAGTCYRVNARGL